MEQSDEGHGAILLALSQTMSWGPQYFQLASQESQNPLLLGYWLEERVCVKKRYPLICLRLESMQISFNFLPAGISQMTPSSYRRAEKYSESAMIFCEYQQSQSYL